MELGELDLHADIARILTQKGISALYPVQELAVKHGLLEGEDLLVASPTASGKTLLAVLAMSKKVVERSGKMVYLSPLRSLAHEKLIEFGAFEGVQKAAGAPLRIAISTGDYDEPAEKLAYYDVLILTYEKFDSIWRRTPSWLNDVSLYVVDELHMLADNKRGPVLEALLSRIRADRPENSQLLAFSATIANAQQLAQWLDLKPITLEWRPVPLREGVYIAERREIRFKDGETKPIRYSGRGDIADLALDTISEGGQALIFTETRRRAVSLARRLQDIGERVLDAEAKQRLASLSRELLSAEESTDLTRTLAQVVGKGVAFHHAGLSSWARRAIEEAFRAGLVPVLCSTTTLAAGVNLPARRVIIASTYRYDEVEGSVPISVMDYRQMGGRAGRPQYDDVGEIVLLASSEAEGQELWARYIEGDLEPISSRLNSQRHFRILALATIAARPGLTFKGLAKYFFNTLIANEKGQDYVVEALSDAKDFLLDQGFVREVRERYLATDFGYRVSTLYIDPLTALGFRDFIRLCAESEPTELETLYTVVAAEDFEPRLPPRSRDIELAEDFLEVHGHEFRVVRPPELDYFAFEQFLKPFRSLLALYYWVQEKGEDDILRDLGVEPGDLHRTVETAIWLTYSLGELAKLMGNLGVYTCCSKLTERMRYGIREELLELVSLEGVGRVRARILYNAGFRTKRDLRRARLEQLSKLPTIGEVMAKKIKAQVQEER